MTDTPPRGSPVPQQPVALLRPVWVGLLGLIATLSIWLALVNHERAQLGQATHTEAQRMAHGIHLHANECIQELEEAANRWALRDGTVPEAEWTRDVGLIERNRHGYQAVEYADKEAVVRYICPIKGNEKAVGLDLDAEPRRREAMERACAERRTVMTRSIRLVQGGLGFITFTPIFRGDDLQGFIVGVFRYQRLLDSLLLEVGPTGYGLSVTEGGQEVYREGPVANESVMEAQDTFDIYGVQWKVKVWQNADLMLVGRSPVPQLVLAIGILLTLLMTQNSYVAQATRRRAVQLTALNEQLEQEIRERIRIENALQEAKNGADTANAAKSRFLATMSHEIRTPMNGIMGMTELALETAEDGEQRHYLSLIKSSADTLLVIINDILDFSKIEAGRLRMDVAPFAVRDMIESAVHVVSPQATFKGLRIDIGLDDDLPSALQGDGPRLHQVLVNLLGNAVKFTEKGGIRVTVSVADTVPGGCTLRVDVIDTGIGISAEQQTDIFEPFTQVDGTLSRRYEGTGLGLAISNQIVRLMGGHIEVESTLGQGSRFTFTAFLERLDESGVTNKEPAVVDDSSGGRRALRVLVAEDNRINRELFERILRLGGHSAVLVSNGREAVERVSQGAFDAVLMDLQMPEMDGFEATRLIRENAPGANGHLRIVAVTAHAIQGDRERCLAAGMDGYVAKPVRPSTLLRTLQDLTI